MGSSLRKSKPGNEEIAGDPRREPPRCQERLQVKIRVLGSTRWDLGREHVRQPALEHHLAVLLFRVRHGQFLEFLRRRGREAPNRRELWPSRPTDPGLPPIPIRVGGLLG